MRGRKRLGYEMFCYPNPEYVVLGAQTFCLKKAKMIRGIELAGVVIAECWIFQVAMHEMQGSSSQTTLDDAVCDNCFRSLALSGSWCRSIV